MCAVHVLPISGIPLVLITIIPFKEICSLHFFALDIQNFMLHMGAI